MPVAAQSRLGFYRMRLCPAGPLSTIAPEAVGTVLGRGGFAGEAQPIRQTHQPSVALELHVSARRRKPARFSPAGKRAAQLDLADGGHTRRAEQRPQRRARPLWPWRLLSSPRQLTISLVLAQAYVITWHSRCYETASNNRALRQPPLECIIGLVTSPVATAEVLRGYVARFEPCRSHVARRARRF